MKWKKKNVWNHQPSKILVNQLKQSLKHIKRWELVESYNYIVRNHRSFFGGFSICRSVCVWISLWIQTLSEKILDPLNHVEKYHNNWRFNGTNDDKPSHFLLGGWHSKMMYIHVYTSWIQVNSYALLGGIFSVWFRGAISGSVEMIFLTDLSSTPSPCNTPNTLCLCQNSYWKWPFIVDFPIKNGDFP